MTGSKDFEIKQRLEKAIRQVIDQQVDENEPPETAATLERLQKSGYSEQDAYELIGKVVSKHVIEFLARGDNFDLDAYCNALETLPDPFTTQPRPQT